LGKFYDKLNDLLAQKEEAKAEAEEVEAETEKLETDKYN